MWESLDFRKFPRLKIKCDIEIREAKTSFNISTVTENIGTGGVCVILDREFSRLTKVFVRLHLIDSSPPIECHGKICWIVKSHTLFKKGNRYDTGIQFLDMNPDDKRLIKQFIDQQPANVENV